MAHEPFMLFAGKSVRHAGDVVGHDAFGFCTGCLQTVAIVKPVKALNMRLRHLRGIVHVGLEQIAHNLLGGLRGLHHLRMAV